MGDTNVVTDVVERHLSVPAIADALGVDRGVVYQAIDEGALRARRLGKRTIRVACSDLEAWLDAARIHPDYVKAVDSPRGTDSDEAAFGEMARAMDRPARGAALANVRQEGRR